MNKFEEWFLKRIIKREVAKKYATPAQTQSVSDNSIGIQSQGSTTVVHDSSSNLLTNVLLYKMMTDHNTNSVSVKYDDDAGRVKISTRDPDSEQKQQEESSYTSSYKSTNDDDDRKSSYSSSYSSSSDDSSYSSSYSSSSSDSSYSSSSSDSSYSSD